MSNELLARIELLERENRILEHENKRLKEEFLKIEDKYIHNVPCCNEEDCDFYKKYKENEADLTTVYLKGYEDGKEKYNHYKLLYQKVKDRNDKAIEFVENYDVFKEFSFPLMKRDEENQVKSSIDYEFQTSIKKSLLQILDKVNE